MKVGITGHQDRAGIQWPWVREILRSKLTEIGTIDRALSSLAAGSDQVFAEVAVDLGIPLTAVVPLENYDRFFKGESLTKYRRLLAQSDPHLLFGGDDAERAFLEAGIYIANECDLLFAVWDGEKAEGIGGTGDIVTYAQKHLKPVIHLEPRSQNVRRI